MASKPTKRKVPGSQYTSPVKGAAKTGTSRSASKVRGDTHQGGTKRSTASETRSKASEAGGKPDKYSQRYTPPVRDASQMPSPMWVPILMFALLGLGMLTIILNYIGLFGDASNWRLILGLGFILGGIMTATQYR